MPLQETSGNVTTDAYGGGTAVTPVYIEDVMSTFLYTGNAPTGQSINNGIDLSTKGGLLWCKNRTTAATLHYLFDTARGFSYSSAESLNTASTAAAQSNGTNYAKPETNGFSFGTGAGSTSPNKNGDNFASWTFRKQPKFFDVVTYTGDGATYSGGGRQITHNLQCRPGFILIKRTDSTGNWIVGAYDGSTNYYVSDSSTPSYNFFLNSTTPGGTFSASDVTPSVNTTINITTLDYPTNSANINGASYVMYVWAAGGAGGFGLTGTDNVITCGSYTTSSVGKATVDLGYEPQWVLVKRSSGTGGWYLADNMRGWSLTQGNTLSPNTSSTETDSWGGSLYPTATGFQDNGVIANSSTVIYIAIRRGPMKVPTDATTVFAPQSTQGPSSGSASGTNPNFTSNFPVDMFIRDYKPGGVTDVFPMALDRLRGGTKRLMTSSTVAEAASNFQFDSQTGVWYPSLSSDSTNNAWMFRRAPSFFDEVCYTGTGSGQAINHNLGALAEIAIVKRRNTTGNWVVGFLGFGASMLLLNTTAAAAQLATGSVTPNWDVNQFYVDQGTSNSNDVNASGSTYVAYLFATCAGVSKVFSFTGNGTTQTINCGFTGGARFVLLKATSTTGGWYVYDTARGMTTLTDPYLFLNSTAAETATLGSVTTVSTGFAVNEAITTGVNTNGVSYIGLAIA